MEFAEFYEASWVPCLRAVVASVGDRALAEDLVAEAFARAWASWRRVSRHAAPRAWVVRTALNEGVSRWRRRRFESLGATEEQRTLDAEDEETLDTALLEALRRLPVRQREVIALRVFLDLDTEATARHLGIAPGTVTAHLSRAVTALRRELAPTGTRRPDDE
jgi:RNA polymerase sigma-70 factor (ECF subfamily)